MRQRSPQWAELACGDDGESSTMSLRRSIVEREARTIWQSSLFFSHFSHFVDLDAAHLHSWEGSIIKFLKQRRQRPLVGNSSAAFMTRRAFFLGGSSDRRPCSRSLLRSNSRRAGTFTVPSSLSWMLGESIGVVERLWCSTNNPAIVRKELN